MLDVDIVEINDEQAYASKLLASSLSEPQIRKRGMIDMLGIACAVNYLHAKKFKIDTRKSVYRISLLFEEFKITDIYYGNYRIDVITLYKEKTVKIPKIHADMDIMPHFYFIVQIGTKIKEAKMIGFVDSKDVLKCSHDSKYYYPTLDLIFDIKKFASVTRRSVATKTLLGKHIDCMGLFLKFIDNDLSSVYKRQMIQHLMNCDSCRSRFIDVMEFEKLANNIRFYPDLAKKYDLRTSVENVALEMDRTKASMSLEESLNNIKIKEIDTETINELEDFNETEKTVKQVKQPKIQKPIQIFDPLDKTDKTDSKKNVIDTIFSEIPKIELPPIKTIVSGKNRHALIVLAVSFFLLMSFALISIKNISSSKQDENAYADFEEYNESYPDDYGYSDGQAKLIPKERNIDDFIIRQPVSNRAAYSPVVTRVSFEAPESLVKKENYTKFLQLIGKNIKLNLQNDLLLVNDVPMNKIVKVDIKIASNGDVNSINITSASGSEAIDASIKKVINDTLTYMKPPSHGIISRPVSVTLTLELN